MGLIDKLKQTGGDSDRESDSKEPREDGDDKARASGHEALPGGASGQEAAEATPQRAAELAD